MTLFLSFSIANRNDTETIKNDQTKNQEQKVGLQIIPILAYYSIVQICENHDMESVGENNEENVMFFGVPKLIERLIAGCL